MQKKVTKIEHTEKQVHRESTVMKPGVRNVKVLLHQLQAAVFWLSAVSPCSLLIQSSSLPLITWRILSY